MSTRRYKKKAWNNPITGTRYLEYKDCDTMTDVMDVAGGFGALAIVAMVAGVVGIASLLKEDKKVEEPVVETKSKEEQELEAKREQLRQQSWRF